eukprot:c20970_g1_i1.p1 GENE.c20970_g1_i1~~c20970_g1_i1.p1  ORF type:complete len:665 (+),score=204.91 c20970_g1_i1:50-1996(+)
MNNKMKLNRIEGESYSNMREDVEEESEDVEEESFWESGDCTDTYFLLFFFLFLGGLGAIWAIGFERGDARRLVFPLDYEGHLCGVDSSNTGGRDLSNRDFLAWYDLRDYQSQVCVSECYSDAIYHNHTISPFFEQTDVYGVRGENFTNNRYSRYNDFEVMRRCIPENLTNADRGFENFVSGNSALQVFTDLERCYWLILAMIPVVIILCILHLFFLRFFANEMIWITVAISISLIAGAGILCILQGLGKHTFMNSVLGDLSVDLILQTARFNFLIVGICLTVFAMCLLLAVCFFGSRIGLVGAIMEEVGKVLSQMPSIVAFPLIPLFMAIGFFILWSFFTMYLLTSHSIDISHEYSASDPGFRIGDMDTSLKYALAFDIIGLLWVIFYILSLTKVTIAKGIYDWFEVKKSGGEADGMWSNFCYVLVFQSGSIALGSFLVLLTFIVKLIARAMEWVLTRETKLSFLEKILACFLCLVEVFLKLINMISHYAFIQMAVDRTNFFACARKTAGIVEANISKIAVVDIVGDFVLFLCKLNVTFLTGYIMTILISQPIVTNYFEFLQPQSMVLVGMAIAFPIASCFFGIFEMGIDTTLICLCNPDEISLISPSLVAMVSDHEKKWKDKKAEKEARKKKLKEQEEKNKTGKTSS